MIGPRFFVTTSPRALGHDLLPMNLCQKAKRLGIWNPLDIDFSQGREDWRRKRFARIEKARNSSVDEIERAALGPELPGDDLVNETPSTAVS